MMASMEELVEVFEGIYRKNGVIDAPDVVKEAKKKTSPLHPYFEWDDSAAAHEHRLHQARMLIRSVKVNVTIEKGEDPVPIKAFYSLESETGVSGYKPVAEILAVPDERDMLLNRAKRELASFRERYKHLEEFAELFEHIESHVA